MPDVNVALEDRAESYWKAARVLRVVGWTSIVWGCMIMIWIWMGLKAGSDMWLIWTIAQFVAGGICLVTAAWLSNAAARTLASSRLVVENHERAA
jgi:4-hydroxybenzoate polyprenyltransferase